MYVKKFDTEFTRRAFLQKAASGVAAAGLLAPLWPTIGRTGEIGKAYPDELVSIEMYTKGKIKPGDVVTADNVEVVKDLLDPVAYRQVKEMGRRINIVETTTDVTRLFPPDYLEATLRNAGRARLDETGNVVTDTGEPWIGGNPFPEPKDGLEAFANLVLSWGRHDESVYGIRDWDISPGGSLSYQYDFIWAEMNTTARVHSHTPYLEDKLDKLRYQAALFTAPFDTKGTAFLNTWHYDQREFPDLLGYLPAFKRVRSFPTNQRFEPLVPGITIFLSDAWAAGDPMLTWGNYKLVDVKPHLASCSRNWTGDRHENWEREVHGGPEGQTFFEDYKELIPECLVIESEPVKYPRAPVGKKRVYVDARNMVYIGYLTFDRRGEIWKTFEPAFSQYDSNGTVLRDDQGRPVWTWTHVHSHDVQSNRMSRFLQAKELPGGYKSEYNSGPRIYDRYLTRQAIRRFGT